MRGWYVLLYGMICVQTMPSLAQSWNMLWEEPPDERPVCTVVWNGLCTNNAIIGSELKHAVGGAIRREAGMYSCME